MSFLPYVSAWREIVTQVFFYGGIPGQYGVSFFLTSVYRMLAHSQTLTMESSVGGTSGGVRMIYIALTAATVVVNVLIAMYLAKRKDSWRSMGHSLVIFLATTTGISAQYFVLPLAFSWTESKLWLIVYTLATTLFLLGNKDEFGIHWLHLFSWNIVWIAVLCWAFGLMRSVLLHSQSASALTGTYEKSNI